MTNVVGGVGFTVKQLQILQTVKKLQSCSVYQIIEHLPYKVKRDALLHSIRVLRNNDFICRHGMVDGKMMFGVTDKLKDYID